MRKALALVTLLALSGCEKASAKAERQEAMVRQSGTPADICAAKRAVADAYLKEENDEAYRLNKGGAEAYCLNAKLSGQLM